MESKRVLIKLAEDESCWRLYWSGTTELADPRSFATMEQAARVAWAIMGHEPGRADFRPTA